METCMNYESIKNIPFINCSLLCILIINYHRSLTWDKSLRDHFSVEFVGKISSGRNI